MNAQENDESLLIDFALGRLDEKTNSEVRRRIKEDPALGNLHQSVANSLTALGLLPESEPPADLVARTLARISQHHQTEALIAREEIGRAHIRPMFSLREALAVAASLLIVLSLTIPSIRQARRTSQIGQCASNMGQIGSALGMYANSNNKRLPSASAGGPRWLPGDRAVSNSSALFKLISNGTAPQLVFICPAASVAGRPFQVNAGMIDFPSGRNIHYSYQHTVGPRELNCTNPALAAAASKMVILADSTPFYRDGSFHPDQAANAASENHGRAGQNVLYLDMHVGWTKQPSAGVNGNNIFLAEGIYNYKGDETPQAPDDTFLLPAFSGAQEASR